jgi:3D (Asp-Asp-Asp) domain-containing protein
MESDSKRLPALGGRKIPLLGGLIILFFLSFSPVSAPSHLAEAEADFIVSQPAPLIIETPIIQENSFLTASSHYLPEDGVIVLETIPVIITAYSSTPEETDDTPFVTASGTQTRDGVVASNLLPFGTKIRIPEYFGNKIFTIEDRMNKRMDDFQIDVWFPSSYQAHLFGVKYTYIETIK